MEPTKLIGVSLATCIIQIAEKVVRRDEVKEIIAACTRKAFLEHVLPNYPKGYWRGLPEQTVKIASEMYLEGLIQFPRDENENHFPITPDLIFWVKTPEEIVWFDES